MSWLLRGKKKKRFLVLGWDCASPELVFDQFAADLPVISALRRQGTWGRLRSSIPCITIPAWASMMSSRDPGELGIYGLRNRVDSSYDHMQIADSSAVRVPRVWDILGEAGLQSTLIGVPQTYPVTPIKGRLVSCFLTPNSQSAFTYPAVFKQEVLQVVPEYAFDVRDFRTEDKQRLLQTIFDFTEVQFKLLKHCVTRHDWDFFMHVNMGVDRIHHGFWRYHDPSHRLHEPVFQNAIRDYYKMIDSMAGQLIELAGDDINVLILSDHGVKRMDGAICLNQWLWQQGWLVLRTPPPAGQVIAFDQFDIDWSRSRAWGSGGYYGRVFLNVQGREAQGTIPPDSYQATRDQLAAELAAIPGPEGERLATQVFQPEQIYHEVRGHAPDLMVYFGDLHWRSVGSLGHELHYIFENDTGPDDANHAEDGMFVLYEPGAGAGGEIKSAQLMDVAPTILHHMGLKIPAAMRGHVLGA